MIYKPENGCMWDPSVLYHDGYSYMVSMLSLIHIILLWYLPSAVTESRRKRKNGSLPGTLRINESALRTAILTTVSVWALRKTERLLILPGL